MTRRLHVPVVGWLLSVSTGALLALAYPPFNISQLGWVALIPLLFAVERCPRGEAFRRGYIAGLVFFAMTIWWIVHVTLPGMVGLVVVLALYFGVAATLFNISNGMFTIVNTMEGSGGILPAVRNIVVAAVAAAGWVTLEWARGRFILGGFPWNFLGVTQWQAVPLIQFASVTGVYGVSALVCFVNCAFYFTLRRFWRQVVDKVPQRRLSWEFYVAMLAICGAMVHGIGEIRRAGTARGRQLQLALVQGNVPQTLKFDLTEKPMILQRYGSLTRTLLVGKPDLIIWPETATPEPLRYDAESFALATNLAVQGRAYLLTGTMDVTPDSDPQEWFNAAILVQPDGALAGIYRKNHLVPFGEYVPFRKILPFMKYLTPIADSFERGRELTVFEMPALGNIRFATVICFEDTVAPLCRQFAQRDIDFLVNVTNDAWFKESPAAEQHLANAVFRAAETRRPLVRAANNGVSCVVDEFGFVRTRLQSFTEASATCELELPATRTQTFYTQRGDVFVGVCALVAGSVVIALAAFRRNKLESPA